MSEPKRGPEVELAYLDLGVGSSYVEPEWPIPDLDDGHVWIQDGRIDPQTELEGSFELREGELRPVTRWDGVVVLAYWSGGQGDARRYSPSLMFPTLTEAVRWGRSVADDVTVRLTTGTRGRWREQPGSDPLPGEILAAWDAQFTA